MLSVHHENTIQVYDPRSSRDVEILNQKIEDYYKLGQVIGTGTLFYFFKIINKVLMAKFIWWFTS